MSCIVSFQPDSDAGTTGTSNATEYEVHPVQVSEWKKTLLERLPEAFEGKKGGRGGGGDFESERSELHSKIGELTVKLDFAAKKSRQLGL